MTQSISHKIARNTLYNALGRFWGIGVALCLTPYIIRHIGIERYGIWAIVGVLTGYFGLLDFGIGTSFVKYIAEFHANKDYRRLNEVINTGFVFYALFGLFITAIGFFFIKHVMLILNVPSELQHEGSSVFLLGIALFCISNAMSCFGAIPIGLQRMDLSNKVAIAMSLFTIAGTVFFLSRGYGLIGLMMNNAIILLLASVINVAIAFKILPELKFNVLLSSFETFKKLFRYGYKLQVTTASTLISLHMDKLLIAHYLSLGLVTYYQLGSTVVNNAKTVPLLLTSALLPAFSEMNAKQEKEKLIQSYIRGTKYLSFVTFPFFTLLIVSAPYFMVLWMGSGYESSARIIQILAVSSIFNILLGVGCSVVQAVDKAEIQMSSSLMNAILSPILSIISIHYFGFSGVAIGASFSICLASFYFIVRINKELNVKHADIFKEAIYLPFFACLCGGLCAWGLGLALSSGIGLNRATGALIIFAQATLLSVIYLILLNRRRGFDEVDKALLADKVPYAHYLVRSFKLEKRLPVS